MSFIPLLRGPLLTRRESERPVGIRGRSGMSWDKGQIWDVLGQGTDLQSLRSAGVSPPHFRGILLQRRWSITLVPDPSLP